MKKFVNEKGDVNYQAVKDDPAGLDDYLKSVMSIDSGTIARWPREETMAYWLNVYHAALIRLVIDHYPETSVQRIPGFWDLAVVRFNAAGKDSESFSLNDIRTKCLLDVYHDEKIHLALSQAAKGGPRLSRDAFTGLKVEGQLFQRVRQFVKDPAFVDIEPGRKKIRISRLFKWYSQDFKLDFGIPEPLGKFSPTETSVLSFLAYYLEDAAQEEFLQGAQYKIEYSMFDWSLNDWKASGA